MLCGTMLFAWACMPLLAQAPQADNRPGRLILEKDWGQKEAADELKQFQALRKAEQPFAESSKTILEHGAQWYAYRLTFSDYHDSKPSTRDKKMLHDITKEALDQIVDPKPGGKAASPALLQFKEEFEKRFVKRLQEVSKKAGGSAPECRHHSGQARRKRL